ncbi:MAG: hypothetical protein FJY85_13310, partial [Deltaproteobacteria bacterium]|nr:hypothetical protein [Deltaproteobacteria bacterium]
MKDNDFEPAKVISKPEPTQKEQSVPKNSTDPSPVEPAPDSDTSKTVPTDPKGTGGDSFSGLLDQFTGKDKSRVVWASPYDMHQNGVFSGLYKATVDRMGGDIQGIIVATIFHAYLLIGYYLLAAFFDSDESLVFSRNPYKDTSINDLAKRDDIPFTRQKLADCIKAAAADMELRKRGHHLEHQHYEHLLQIARLKKQEQRLEKALEANEQKLTSNELKKRIDKILGKT